MSIWKKFYVYPSSDENHSWRALEDHIMASLINNTLQDQYIFLAPCAWHLDARRSSPHILLCSPNMWLGFCFQLLQQNQTSVPEASNCSWAMWPWEHHKISCHLKKKLPKRQSEVRDTTFWLPMLTFSDIDSCIISWHYCISLKN